MPFKLSDSELSRLTILYKKEKNKTRANRINIILLLHKGYKGVEISSILNLDQDTITKWKSRYLNRVDDESWLDDAYQPYVGKLSYVEISQLRKYVMTFLVGNKKELASFIEQSYCVSYSPSGLNRLLHRACLSWQTIHKLPGKCPVHLQEEWIKKFDEKLKNTDFSTEVILFMDSVHPTHNSVYTKLWSQIGLPRWISSNTGRNRVNISGAYNPVNQELVVIEGKTVNGEATIELLKKCLEKYTDKETITIYLDNASYHKSKEVKSFLEEHPKIQFSFLPPYSPNLNLIERLWKFVNEKVINLKYYPEFSEFKNKLLNFYDNIHVYADELERRITFNFQTFQNCVA
ncbi:MAG: IS630 family transposase [Bacteroidales bacterium]|jgi:transposase|nr:IS630 family transposase [Bacteroidales bacterium]